MKEIRKEHDIGSKARVLTLREEGYSYNEISNRLGLAKSMVQYILKNYKKYKSLQNPKRKGRKKTTTKSEDSLILIQAKKNKNFSLSQQQFNLDKYYNINLSTETIRLRLYMRVV